MPLSVGSSRSGLASRLAPEVRPLRGVGAMTDRPRWFGGRFGGGGGLCILPSYLLSSALEALCVDTFLGIITGGSSVNSGVEAAVRLSSNGLISRSAGSKAARASCTRIWNLRALASDITFWLRRWKTLATPAESAQLRALANTSLWLASSSFFTSSNTFSWPALPSLPSADAFLTAATVASARFCSSAICWVSSRFMAWVVSTFFAKFLHCETMLLNSDCSPVLAGGAPACEPVAGEPPVPSAESVAPPWSACLCCLSCVSSIFSVSAHLALSTATSAWKISNSCCRACLRSSSRFSSSSGVICDWSTWHAVLSCSATCAAFSRRH
mmetsp:Transcript_40685/g.105252  ORF Transcript_40685/g.105252 Transcript_40685/m.105252 type:complete len:327 (-) Transcript_40685:573-1553(-)